jgi:hypothetical protein
VDTLRALLIQRAARLQEWPALTAPGWGTLRYPAFRNRVEGVALGLMASGPAVGSAAHSGTGGPWDWAAEAACACCGLVWSPAGPPVPAPVLGGVDFNAEAGRQPYHDRERQVLADTPFSGALTHGQLLARLARANRQLGWDHETEVLLPLDRLGTAAIRGALWSALFAGAHAILSPGPVPAWTPEPFAALLDGSFLSDPLNNI